MSRFIDLVETFDFTTLEYESYGEKIDDLLKRFPKYEEDDRIRTVLPNKFNKTVDDFVSMKFCIKGRYPIYGIYSRRDLNLVGVCVQGNIMYALDDCDLHPSFVPDLQFRKLHLEIQYSPLATRETLNYTKKCMCSAISTLSLGYNPQKKNEWCEAVVLLTGMTSQAVRFFNMKDHVQTGLLYTTAHDTAEPDGRYALSVHDIALQHRWNKVSKAIRRKEYPFAFSHYADDGQYNNYAVTKFSAGREVLLINDKDKTKGEKYRRRICKWNGPLGNSIRKLEEECHRKYLIKREERPGDKPSERMHGLWFGSLDTFKHEVTSVKCLRRLAQMVRDNEYLVSEKPPLDGLKVVLQVRTTLASIPSAVKNIWNEGGLLPFFRGIVIEIDKLRPQSTSKFNTYKMINAWSKESQKYISSLVKLVKISYFSSFSEPNVKLLQMFYLVLVYVVGKSMMLKNQGSGYFWLSRPRPDQCFYKGLVPILLNILPSARAATKLKAVI